MRTSSTKTRGQGRPRRIVSSERELPPGWVHIDLGVGEAAYAEASVPGSGETHPHSLGFNGNGPGASDLEPKIVAAFEPTEARHWHMPPRPAGTLRVERHAWETEQGRRDLGLPLPALPLAAWTWCVSCGKLFRDKRVDAGENLPGGYRPEYSGWSDGLEAITGGVALYCDGCRHSRSRSLPATRLCGAPACDATFVPTDRRTMTCSNACRKRLGDWRLKHQEMRTFLELRTRPTEPAFGFPCIGKAHPHECWCPSCHLSRKESSCCDAHRLDSAVLSPPLSPLPIAPSEGHPGRR